MATKVPSFLVVPSSPFLHYANREVGTNLGTRPHGSPGVDEADPLRFGEGVSDGGLDYGLIRHCCGASCFASGWRIDGPEI